MNKLKTTTIVRCSFQMAFLIALLGSLIILMGRNNVLAQQSDTKFSTALESQISCGQPLEPAKAVGALQRAGMIERRSYLNLDSLSYFKAKSPLTVWGFRVVSVFGFAQNPRIFERGPGTAPPVILGVVVPYSEREVKAKLSSFGLSNIGVQRAMESDVTQKRGRHSNLTEIYCTDNHNY